MGLSHAGQRRLRGARCPRASALLFPGGGGRAGSAQVGERAKRRRWRKAAGARRGQRLFPSRGRPGKGAGISSPLLAPPPRRPRWSEAGVKRERRFPSGTQLPPARGALRHPSGSLPASTPPLRIRLCCGAEGCAALCRDHAVSGRPRISAVKLRAFVLRKLRARLRASSVCTLQTRKVFLAGVFQSHEEDDRKVRRREKNRVAAQRSRKKQTQKADKLHEVNGHLVLCRHGLGTKHETLQ